MFGKIATIFEVLLIVIEQEGIFFTTKQKYKDFQLQINLIKDLLDNGGNLFKIRNLLQSSINMACPFDLNKYKFYDKIWMDSWQKVDLTKENVVFVIGRSNSGKTALIKH